MRPHHCLILIVACCVSKCFAELSVVIVGAGASGVAAASKLLEHNHTNIVILEAEPRIGGRINSVKFGDGVVDLGAHWVEGTEGNVVYELVKDLNMLKRLEPISAKSLYFHSSKGKVDADIAKLADDTFELCYSSSNKKKDEHLDHTLAESCKKAIEDSFAKLQITDEDKKKIIKSIPSLVEKQIYGYDGAFNWDKLPEIDDYVELDDEYFTWKGKGFKTVLDVLTKKLPDPSKQLPFDEKVHFNKEVKKIVWENKAKVDIECTDGSHYIADHVIFTPSVGVLKNNYKTMFEPRLPHVKEDVIDKLGYDAVMFVHFHFPAKWWPEDFTNAIFLWDEEDVKSLPNVYPKGPIKNNHHWLTEFVQIEASDGNPNVLSAWMAGELIPEIEKLPKETLMDGFDFLLKKFMGNHYNVTKPDDEIHMSWYSNPHFHGTFSYQTIESRKKEEPSGAELSKPMLNEAGKPLVLFAGEATHLHYFGSVHGAIETGYREAERVMKFINGNQL